jgi:uncharacterized protein
MQVGIGWRHGHYSQLLATLPCVDFLEVHSENFFGAGGPALHCLTQARKHYPISLHGVGLSLGSACGLDVAHLQQLCRLAERIDPIRVSDHACFARVMHPNEQAVHASDLLPIAWNDTTLDAMCSNIAQAQDALKRPLAIENLSAYLAWPNSTMLETDFLAALVRRTGCQLLVDVNNLIVNGKNMHLGHVPSIQTAPSALAHAKQWLDQLHRALGPLAPRCMAEIHVAGHVQTPDLVVDEHGSPVDDDTWQAYRHAIGLWQAVPTLVEWDNHLPDLQVLLQQAHDARQHMHEVLAA